MTAATRPRRPLLRLAAASAALLWALLAPVLAGDAGVSLRVVDETAPPAGLAVVFVELTEPKPLSGGRVRFAFGGGPLVEVMAVALLDAVGQVEADLLSTDQGAVVQFRSEGATFGVSPDIPIMAVAISVSPSAQPGQTVPLMLDLGDSTFLDPQGVPYPEEVKPGLFTVGGVSITAMDPSSGMVAAGSAIRFSGVGFEPGFDLNVEQATFSDVRLAPSGEIVATLAADFTILPTTRVRLRNPSRSEDFYYPAVASRPAGVNRVPVAQADFATTAEDSVIDIDVLSNDSDPDGDPLSIDSLGSPSHGSVQLVAGMARYSPQADFAGADTFAYTVADGRGGRASASVQVVVEAVNDPPTAVVDSVETAPDQLVEIAVLDNDTDVDGDGLIVLAVQAPDQGLAAVHGATGVVYAPPPGFQGQARFRYQASDGQGGLAEGLVDVTVQTPDSPPQAVDDAAVTVEGAEIGIALLENDSDANGDALAIETVAPPAHGTVQTGVDGLAVYRPAPDFVGSDAFGYTLMDASGMASQASVAVAVNSPDAPYGFTEGPRRMVAGTAARLELTLIEPASEEVRLELSSSAPEVVAAPEFVTVPGGSTSVRFTVYAASPGAAVLEARRGGLFSGLPVLVSEGVVTEIPVSLFDNPNGLGLALANRDGRTAKIRLRGTLQPTEGAPAPETELTLEPYRQTSRTPGEYGESFEGFRGWLEVSSSDPRVFSMFLNFDGQIRGLAGSSSAARSPGHFLPCLGATGAPGFEFSLINNQSQPAIVDFAWTDANGLGPTERRAIQPQTALIASDRDFSSGPGCQGGLIVDSSLPLAAYQSMETPELLLGQTPPPAEGSASRLFLPQCVSGGGWSTALTLSNLSETAAEAEIVFRGAQGPQAVVAAIGSRATLELDVGGLFGWRDDEVRVGSLEIRSTGGIAGSAALILRGGPALGTVSPLFARAGQELIFPQAVSGLIQGVDFFTGLAVQNTGSQEAVVFVDVISESGQLRGMDWLRIAPEGRVSLLLDQLLPDLGPLGGGHVRLRSTQPVAALEIFGDRDLSFLATVPPAYP